MKILGVTEKEKRAFEDLDRGDVFQAEGSDSFYMKIEMMEGFNAVSLSDGSLKYCTLERKNP